MQNEPIRLAMVAAFHGVIVVVKVNATQPGKLAVRNVTLTFQHGLRPQVHRAFRAPQAPHTFQTAPFFQGWH